jgi:PiT family inorganic phosphate transporter
MSEIALPGAALPIPEAGGPRPPRPHMDHRPPAAAIFIFSVLLLAGVGLTVYGLTHDVAVAGGEPLAIGAFLLLGVALLIALGFEFVNGFHDTANAVATVIYTHALPANIAVVWSGGWNLLGVLASSGTVAFSVLSLLPVELILQVGSSAGYAMIFALLIAAIVWNLCTWSLGLPASSSHTLVGSIIGVGLANQMMNETGSGTSGVDWGQAMGVFRALLVSPVFGFVGAALILLAMKAVIRSKKMFSEPDVGHPPPLPIRLLLILTCTLVSFFHGSNDGQKGMGLIMLILIGALPTAYALNRALPDSETPAFVSTMQRGEALFAQRAGTAAAPADPAAAKEQVTAAIRARSVSDPAVYAAVGTLTRDIVSQVTANGAIAHVPAGAVQNVRNDMYLASEAVRFMPKTGVSDADTKTLADYKKALDRGTKFIPWWVKVTVAIALGLGTMVGWKRIVVTVGEKIGKTHLSYGQGASAELMAAATIAAADVYGLPVSTTHVLSSGVAGAMAANGSGLQWGTLRNLAMAWVLTLPAAIVMSASLYWIFRSVF